MTVQKILAVFLCGIAVSAMGIESTSAVKIGYVDLQKALQSTDVGKTAKSQLDKDVNAKRMQLEKQQGTLQKEAEEFEKKAALMNEATKMKTQTELQKKFAEFQKAAGESQAELQKKERDLTKPIIDELRAVIEGMGQDKKYDLILEKNESAVLYAKADADITETVIEKFNANVKKKKK